jgi:predicted RNA binding protein YcfA (HicA-like mRNA interferase family)
MSTWSSREIVRMLKDDGWYEVDCDGDHHQFKHPTKPGRVTVTHPRKDIPQGTVRSIYKQAGWDWRTRRDR